MRLKANEAAIVSLRMKNYNDLSDNKQVCIVPNPKNQSAAVLGRSFSITKSCLCVSVLLNTLDILITIQSGRKLGYALPMNEGLEVWIPTESTSSLRGLETQPFMDIALPG